MRFWLRPAQGFAWAEAEADPPISRWHYTSDAAASHIGPMAQDFHAAFGLGSDEKHIATVDADGVTLAAIQGLHQAVKEKEARIKNLEQNVAELKEIVKKLTEAKEANR